MIKHFSDWMRLVNIDPTDHLLKTRWGSIETLDESASASDVPELVKLYRNRPANPAFIARFESAFQDSDSAFSLKSSGAAVQVLAGTALARIVTSDDKRADLVALAIEATRRWNPGARLLQELEQMSQTRLDSRGRLVRMVTLGRFSTEEKSLKKAFGAVVTKWTTDAATMKEPLEALSALVLKTLSGIDGTLSSALQFQREETDVLWWLFGGISRDQHGSFAQIGLRAIPMVAAKELADLTTTTPGLPASAAFLQRAIELAGATPDAPLALLNAVNALDRSWRDGWVRSTDDALADLSPALSAVRTSVSIPQEEHWPAAFHARSGFDPKTEWPTIDIAEQLYAELLMRRVYADLSRS